MQHGLQKVFGLLGAKEQPPLMSQAGIGGIIELVGGGLFLLGLFTRPVAFILSGTMAVAYFQFHAPGGFWPVVNKGELAALYCFVFLFFTAAGAGPLSLDAMLRRKR
jgi:putative oxidoreductase